MINSKKDYIYYLEQDKKNLGVRGTLKDWLFHDIWRFQRALRRAEYWSNCKKTVFGKLLALFFRYKAKKTGLRMGFTIPINVFAEGLSIAHTGTIVVNSKARIGKNCRVHVCVNIGASTHNSLQVPKVGDDCYIGPGAKLYGDIVIGNNTGIGANSVVNKSFEDGNQTIAGLPAKKIANKGPLEFRSFSVVKGSQS